MGSGLIQDHLVDNKLHGSGRLVNSGVKLQIDKVAES